MNRVANQLIEFMVQFGCVGLELLFFYIPHYIIFLVCAISFWDSPAVYRPVICLHPELVEGHQWANGLINRRLQRKPSAFSQ